MADTVAGWLSVLIDPLNACIVLLIPAVIASRGKWQRRSGTIGLLLLVLLSLPFFSQFLMHTLERRYPDLLLDEIPSANMLVVLGGALKVPQGNWFDAELASESQRLLVAHRIYQAGKASEILLIGGNKSSRRDVDAEAIYSRRLLKQWGIPEDDVQIGTSSSNTEQDIDYFRNALESELNFGNQKPTILVISSAYHLPRAMALTCSINATLIAIPATHYSHGRPSLGGAAWIPGSGHLKNSTIVIREYVRIVSYAMMGLTSWSALWSNACADILIGSTK